MTLRTINVTNTVDQWKDQYNNLAVDVGDLSTLTTVTNSSLVSAINSLVVLVDSSATVNVARSALTGGSNISYDSDTGTISLAISNNTITNNMMADSSVGTSELRNEAVTFAKMADSSVGSNKLRQAVQLIIYNSAGAALKTLYGAGE